MLILMPIFWFNLISFWFNFQFLHFSFLISVVTSMSMWTLMPIFCFNFKFILILYSGISFSISIFYSITLFNSMFVLCRGLRCLHSCQYFIQLLYNFQFDFPLFHFVLLFFYSKTYFFKIFVMCWQLQCWRSCRYFDLTLISFFISFSLLHFLFVLFFLNNFILIYFCAVLTTAMSKLIPIFLFEIFHC